MAAPLALLNLMEQETFHWMLVSYAGVVAKNTFALSILSVLVLCYSENTCFRTSAF